MSNIKKNSFSEDSVEYPSAEKAYAIVNLNKVPFSRAAVGITFPLPNYCIHRPKENATSVFEYVVEGEGEILIDGVWKRAVAGDFYILVQGEEHNYRAAKKNPWKKLWINYRAGYIPSFLSSYGVTSGIFRAEGVKEMFEELIELTKSQEDKTYISFEIADRVNRIIKIAAKETCVYDGDKYGMRRLVESYIHKKLNLDEVAAELHMSKSNVIRIFKKEYGTTPYEYVLKLKMETAKVLLRDTSIPVWKISEKLCISDEHYFSSMFLKRVGMRPGQYRKANRQ